MKKHKISVILLFIIMLLCSFPLFVENIQAEEQTEESPEEYTSEINCDNAANDEQKRKCMSNNQKCIDYLSKFNDMITFKYENDTEQAIYKGNPLVSEGNVNINGGKVHYTKEVDRSGNIITNTATTIQPIITIKSDSVYKDGNDVYKCNGELKHNFIIYEPKFEVEEYDNPLLQDGKICKNYLEGHQTGDTILDRVENGQKVNSYAYLNRISNNKFKDYFNRYVGYCNLNKVTENYTQAQIISKIKTAIANYKTDLSYQSSSTTNITNGWLNGVTRIDDPKKVHLTCDAFGSTVQIDRVDEETRKNAFIEQNGIELNKRVFYKEGEPRIVRATYTTLDSNGREVTTNPEVCRVTCYEKVTTTYYPPITVKAGTCFQYEVEVKSEVRCDTTFNDDGTPPVVQDRPTCKFRPHCTYEYGTPHTQAGPNEDFEECISTKFKGKYTQKAINHCYNKVYKKKDNKKVNNQLEEVTAVKMANNNTNNTTTLPDWCDVTQFTVAKANEIAYKAWHAYTVEGYVGGEFVQSGNNTGIYNSRGGTVNWKPYTDGNTPTDTSVNYIPNCYWNKYASFYFSNLTHAQGTVLNDYHIAVAQDNNGQHINRTLENDEYQARLNHNNYRTVNSYGGLAGGTLISLRQNYNHNTAHVYAFSSRESITWYEPSIETGEGYDYYTRGYGNITIHQRITGIKWANHTWNNTNYICGDSCSYVLEGSSNCVLNQSLDSNRLDYNDINQQEYDRARAQCTVGSVCKSNSVTYNFQVQNGNKVGFNNNEINACRYNSNNNSSSGLCTKWQQTNNKNQPITENSFMNYMNRLVSDYANNAQDKKIVKKVQGTCATNTNANNPYNYWDVMTFYGWPTKKGVPYFSSTINRNTKYGFKPQEFCIPTSAKEVNKNWGYWDQGMNSFSQSGPRNIDAARQLIGTDVTAYTPTSQTEYGDSTRTTFYRLNRADETGNNTYNIFGKITNFGYFDWNIDYSCFYSIVEEHSPTIPNNPPNDGPTPTSTDGGDSGSKDTTYTRTVTLGNLFPGSGE